MIKCDLCNRKIDHPQGDEISIEVRVISKPIGLHDPGEGVSRLLAGSVIKAHFHQSPCASNLPPLQKDLGQLAKIITTRLLRLVRNDKKEVKD